MRMIMPAMAGLLIFMAIPPVAGWMESTMTGQMLIQMPLLIAAGYGIGKYLGHKLPFLSLYLGGIPGILIVAFTLAFWMLPRSLDATLESQVMEIVKFVSLPVGVGIPLGIGWRKLGFVAREVFRLHLISMIFLMGWLYIAAPVRVCNRYLVDEQKLAGWILIGLGIAVVLYHMVMAVINALYAEAPAESEFEPGPVS